MLNAGILFPIQLNKRDDIAIGSGDDLAITDLTFLFGVQKSECEWDGDFGTELHKLKHMKAAAMIGKAIVIRQVTDQINKYAKKYLPTNAKTETRGDEVKVSIEVADRANIAKRLHVEVEI